ncbi:hypothetical protein TNCV_2401981 [Trichonephila clavipes]|nr:hypothetical protein TNCV_2401981 [Trichonephila clavipes]
MEGAKKKIVIYAENAPLEAYKTVYLHAIKGYSYLKDVTLQFQVYKKSKAWCLQIIMTVGSRKRSLYLLFSKAIMNPWLKLWLEEAWDGTKPV